MSLFGDGCISTHTDHTSTRRVIHKRRISSVTFTLAHLHSNVYIPVCVAGALADSSDFRLLGEQSSQKWDFLPWTPTNRREKFDATSFILGGQIRNRTNTQTNKQTVNDISAPCLSACVDNNPKTEHGINLEFSEFFSTSATQRRMTAAGSQVFPTFCSSATVVLAFLKSPSDRFRNPYSKHVSTAPSKQFSFWLTELWNCN